MTPTTLMGILILLMALYLAVPTTQMHHPALKSAKEALYGLVVLLSVFGGLMLAIGGL